MFYQKLSSLFIFFAICGRSHATGDYLAPSVLSHGGHPITGTPEFFWELECKRIAMEFPAPEKHIAAPTPATAQVKTEEEDKPLPDPREDFTTAMDLADFQLALQNGTIKPPDPDAATTAHAAAREVVRLSSSTRTDSRLPAEAAGEFAEYHKGALAYKTKHPEEARAVWEALLARPATERKYRSTWAAYMLGRSALDEHQFAKAAGYFQQTRKLARDGCLDSLGLAAESYGWEARCELELGHSETSAKLYLTQLATGDSSAVVSLKWFIPDWGATVKGDDHAKPGISSEPVGPVTDPGPAADTPRGTKALDAAAHSPLLRRLISAHILASATPVDSPDSSYLNPAERGTHQAKWLAALDKAGVKDSPDAEYIAWVAYSAGKYQDAKRWLAKSTGTSAAALWLKAKFALRDGKVADGTQLLSQALHVFQSPRAKLENSITWGGYRVPSELATAELGVLHLAQSDFIQALNAFIAAGLWADAAYVAERCLSKTELLDYTRNQKFKDAMPETDGDNRDTANSFSPARFRDLVARRMVREDDYQTAKEFFTPEKSKALDDYTTSLAKGTDAAKSKSEQARALFHAAWIARYQGLELMGTEVGPDNALADGEFNEGDLAMARLTGREPVIEDIQEGDDKESANKPLTFTLPVTKQEKERLQATKLVVERRFHYRHVAAGLAWKAAGLLPDNTAETADILNAAGNWLKAKHEKQAGRFFLALKNRCPDTEIGRQAVAKRWFVNLDGPWSEDENRRMRQPQP